MAHVVFVVEFPQLLAGVSSIKRVPHPGDVGRSMEGARVDDCRS